MEVRLTGRDRQGEWALRYLTYDGSGSPPHHLQPTVLCRSPAQDQTWKLVHFTSKVGTR